MNRLLLPATACLVALFVGATATVASADPHVNHADLRRTKRGAGAAVRGTLLDGDITLPAAVSVSTGDASWLVPPERWRGSNSKGRWSSRVAGGPTLRIDVRHGRFTLTGAKCASSDFKTPLAFVLDTDTAAPWTFEVPLTGNARVLKFNGDLAPKVIPPDPDPDPDPDPNPLPIVTNPKVVGYFTNWGIYQRGFTVKSLEASGSAARLTHICYAFAGIGSDLRVTLSDAYADYDKYNDAAASVDGVSDTWDVGALRGNFNQLKRLKALHPSLKVLIAVGGWTLSSRFSDAALTPTSRAQFADSVVSMFIQGHVAPGIEAPGVFDGVDIDWEYPGSPGYTNDYRLEDTANFTALLAAIRTRLDTEGAAAGRRFELTIAAPADPVKAAKIQWTAVRDLVDFVDLMAYDLRGAWDATTGHHAPLHVAPSDPGAATALSLADVLASYEAAGVPRAKLIAGVPFYGRGWSGVSAGPNGDGMFQSATGAATGTYENGYEDYHVLASRTVPGGLRRDTAAGAVWTYDAAAGVLWSFDDPVSLAAKAQFVADGRWGGVMAWELSGDTSDGALMRALAR
ncbi:MAG: glycoside hydrolase family 18 protein [Planctomycetes bacterium]|nr:glycoside hydrolase family 18 protein [Planctomycetota bacterium]